MKYGCRNLPVTDTVRGFHYPLLSKQAMSLVKMLGHLSEKGGNLLELGLITSQLVPMCGEDSTLGFRGKNLREKGLRYFCQFF